MFNAQQCYTTNPYTKNNFLAIFLFQQRKYSTHFNIEVICIEMTHWKRLSQGEGITDNFNVFIYLYIKEKSSMYIFFLSLSLNLSKSLNPPLPTAETVSALCLLIPSLPARQETREKITVRRWWESLMCMTSFYLLTSTPINCDEENRIKFTIFKNII